MPEDPKPSWLQQSPIRIDTGGAIQATFKADYLILNYPDRELEGYFQQHNFWFEEQPRLTLDGKAAHLERLHIHSPSEHWLDRRRFDFEIHFVNPFDDPSIESKAVVLAVFLREDEQAKTPPS